LVYPVISSIVAREITSSPPENNPDVMTHLATQLGLPSTLAFYDVYSLTEPSLLSLIPRPAHALLVTIPMTPAWNAVRQAEESSVGNYSGSGPQEPVLWFKQTIGHACGLIGLLHSVLNGPAAEMIVEKSELQRLLKEAIPLKTVERAKLLEDSDVLEAAHHAAAVAGDTEAPDIDTAERLGNHFIAFVKGKDGHLWELEGSRKGPLDRGLLGEGDDVLSERALELGIKRYVKLEEEAGGKELRFSCLALAPKEE
jgi:ubiquitin carboxyl-terminal hydrolase L3